MRIFNSKLSIFIPSSCRNNCMSQIQTIRFQTGLNRRNSLIFINNNAKYIKFLVSYIWTF